MATFAGTWNRLGVTAVVGLAGLSGCAALSGCDEKVSADVATVKIGGKTFHLEVAADDKKRMLGLGKRTSIDDDGGMIFVFSEPAEQSFVMRDCPIPIDIMYLDGSGRILKMHEMVPETPRGADEKEEDPVGNQKYNDRLKRYPSKFNSQMVIELQGGMMKKLGVKEDDQVKLNAAELKKLAK